MRQQMRQLWKRTLMPALVTTGFVAVNGLAVKPAFAEGHWLRDIGIGTGVGAAAGVVTNDDSTLSNAANGAAAGAAVHVVHKEFGSHPRHQDLARDAGVGAAAGTVAGILTNRHNPVSNAVNGAAAGAAINLLTH